jgi:hypothetical protein
MLRTHPGLSLIGGFPHSLLPMFSPPHKLPQVRDPRQQALFLGQIGGGRSHDFDLRPIPRDFRGSKAFRCPQ